MSSSRCQLPFVVLDIETTGFDSQHDQIIEVAIVRVENGEVVDSYESLVSAGDTKIPDIVTHITGIKDEDLVGAPNLSDIQQKILDFIQDYPIVGHNIKFDTGFLKAKGIQFENREWDTFPLATILLPKNESFSLETLSKNLNIQHVDKHRAMGDVLANLELFHALWEEFKWKDPEVLTNILECIDRSDWLVQDLFQEAIRQNVFQKKNEEDTSKETEDQSKPFDYSLETLFQEDYGFKRVLPEFMYRKDQEDLTYEILTSLQDETSLITEAPAGIGKTLSYITASVLSKKQVVVSTSTLQLQNQLIQKDLPLVKQLFPDISYYILKGKKNYFCKKRFRSFLKKEHFSKEESILIAKVFLWMNETQTGEKDELNLYHDDYRIFEEYFSAIDCHTNDDHKDCFFPKARSKAHDADILVVNHYLLFADSSQKDPILPQREVLVIDEAHRVEDTLSGSLSRELSLKYFEFKIQAILSALRVISPNGETEAIQEKLKAYDEDLVMYFSVWILYAREFFNPEEYTTKIIIEDKMKEREDYQNVLESTRNILLKWNAIKTDILKLSNGVSPEIEYAISEIEEVFELLQCIVMQEDDGFIRYYHLDQEGNFSLHITPRDVGTFFQEKIVDSKKSVILVSATLSDFVGPEKDYETNFHYIRHVLNLDEDVRERVFAMPEKVQNALQVLVPEDVPEPQRPGNYKKVCKVMFDVIRIAQGRTLGLFTSYKSLESVYMNIAPHFKGQGVHVLGQGVSGGLGKIIHAYKDSPENSVIFGTGTFWEGIDFKDAPLRCLCIHRLPFDPPSDPILKERMKRFKDSFKEYMIPRSIIRFKQGLGRLLRDESSKGIIVILDARVVTKGFGGKYLEMFPENTVHVISQSEVEEYMSKNKHLLD